jgi:hypothetical protein
LSEKPKKKAGRCSVVVYEIVVLLSATLLLVLVISIPQKIVKHDLYGPKGGHTLDLGRT